MSSARWYGVVSDDVTAHVLRYRADEALLRRFEMYVDFGFSGSDCRVWMGALSGEGYGLFALPRAGAPKRVVNAHRAAYLWRFGVPAPETPYLDHRLECVGRFCVNPWHLEPVDHGENVRRGSGVGRAGQRGARTLVLELRTLRRLDGEPGVL